MTTKIAGDQILNYTINTEQLSNTATAAFAKTLAPKIQYANVASNTYTVLDDTAVNVGGGFIVVTGAEFQSGATVLIDSTPASAVTYVNSTTLRAQIPGKSAASYNLYVVNPDGGVGIKPAGITYSSEPSWVTSSPLANVTSNTVFSGNVSATGATSYANTTILPTGFNLLANGYYYGNISVGLATTYSFDIKATDNELQDSTKTFSLTAVTTIPSTLLAGGSAGQPAGGSSASSNLTPGGDRTSSDAFDNSLDSNTNCYHSAPDPGNVVFNVDMGSQKTLTYYRLLSRAPDNDWKPATWTLFGSNDNSNFTQIDSVFRVAMPNALSTNVQTEVAAGRYTQSTIASPAAYRYYRFVFTERLNSAGNGYESLATNYLVIGEMLLYGY